MMWMQDLLRKYDFWIAFLKTNHFDKHSTVRYEQDNILNKLVVLTLPILCLEYLLFEQAAPSSEPRGTIVYHWHESDP